MKARVTGPDYKMDFFVRDFLASTLTMSGEEKGALAISLLVAWTQGATLPVDPDRIRCAAGYDPDTWARVWPALEPKWPLTADGSKRRNPRQIEEWDKAVARTEKAHEKSVAMNEAKPKKNPPDSPLQGSTQ